MKEIDQSRRILNNQSIGFQDALFSEAAKILIDHNAPEVTGHVTSEIHTNQGVQTIVFDDERIKQIATCRGILIVFDQTNRH